MLRLEPKGCEVPKEGTGQSMKRRLRALLAACVATLTAAGLLMAVISGAPAAKAASLVQVTNFGNNPSNNKMYIYVPNNVRANPPILVALHQCTGTGPGFFGSTAFASLADQYGFIVIYPDAPHGFQGILHAARHVQLFLRPHDEIAIGQDRCEFGCHAR